VFYGIGQALGKHAMGSLAAPSMVVVNFVVTMPIYLAFLAWFIFSGDFALAGTVAIVYGLAAAFLGRTGYYTYLEAVEKGPVTIVGSITAAYPAIITVLAIVLLGESVTVLQIFGVAVIVGGMIGLSFSHGEEGGKPSLPRISLIFSIATLALWGVWGVFVKLALEVLPIFYYLGLYAIVLPPLFLVYARHKKRIGVRIMPKRSIFVLIAVVAALIGQIGLFADTAAVSTGEAAIVFPLIASYPVVMILIAYAFLKERLTRRDMMFVIAVVAGIVLVSTV